MILYVPFPRSQAGDLVNAVEAWKNEQNKLSNESVHIIYHGDDFDFEATTALPSEIYICAHGFSDNFPLIVGNNVELAKTAYLNIGTVADRFNQDFGAVFHQISEIHLYCCGSQNKNKKMAEEFRIDLLRKEISIHSYAGSISTPDSNGIRWSFSSTLVTPVKNTESVLSKQESREVPLHRMFFKTTVLMMLHEKAKEARRHNFFAEGKTARQAEIYRRRHAEPMEATPTNVVPPSADDVSALGTPSAMN